MLKKITVGVSALALMGFATSAMAQQLSNPWVNDGAEVEVEINVGAIGEVWSSMGTDQARNSVAPPTLEVTNAGGNVPASGIAEDTLNHFANVNYQVSVTLDGSTDIPEFTRFHVLVGVSNRGAYDAVAGGGTGGNTQAAADSIVTWDRRDSGTGYVGPNGPGTAVPILTGSPSTSANQTLVDYAVDAIHGLPPTANPTIELVYTITQN